MKHSSEGKKFLADKGDKKIRNLIRKGGRKGALKDFNELLRRASKPIGN